MASAGSGTGDLCLPVERFARIRTVDLPTEGGAGPAAGRIRPSRRRGKSAEIPRAVVGAVFERVGGPAGHDWQEEHS